MENNWTVQFSNNDQDVTVFHNDEGVTVDVEGTLVFDGSAGDLDEAFEVANEHVAFLNARDKILEELSEELEVLETNLEDAYTLGTTYLYPSILESIVSDIEDEIAEVNDSIEELSDLTLEDFLEEEENRENEEAIQDFLELLDTCIDELKDQAELEETANGFVRGPFSTIQ